jgi:glutamyl-tRNA reductase
MTGRRSDSSFSKPHILVLGLNHKTAPIAVRECLAFAEKEIDAALENLIGCDAIREALLVSTCNRVEVLVTTDDPQTAASQIKEFIAGFKQQPLDAFENVFYVHLDEDAVHHLFRVAASLDSMVVGEPQILGQIKAA